MGYQSDPFGALFILFKPGIRLEAACRTKREPSQNVRTLSYLLVTDSALGWVILCFGALKHELCPLRSRMGPKSDILFIFFFFVILARLKKW